MRSSTSRSVSSSGHADQRIPTTKSSSPRSLVLSPWSQPVPPNSWQVRQVGFCSARFRLQSCPPEPWPCGEPGCVQACRLHRMRICRVLGSRLGRCRAPNRPWCTSRASVYHCASSDPADAGARHTTSVPMHHTKTTLLSWREGVADAWANAQGGESTTSNVGTAHAHTCGRPRPRRAGNFRVAIAS